MAKEEMTMIQLPGERPFALYGNRLLLSCSKDGKSDLIFKGSTADLATSLLLIMRQHQPIAEFFVEVADAFKLGDNILKG